MRLVFLNGQLMREGKDEDYEWVEGETSEEETKLSWNRQVEGAQVRVVVVPGAYELLGDFLRSVEA